MTEIERAYWEAIRNGTRADGLVAPPVITKPNLARWNKFDFDRHAKLSEAKRLIVEWYNERLPHGGGLILAGDCGCGKTHLAQAVRDIHVLRARYWSEIELIRSIQDSFGNRGIRSKAEILLEIAEAELFVLDDLGAYETDNMRWMQTIYMELLDTRCDRGKPFLITTNKTKAQFVPRVGKRVASRVFGALDESRLFVDLFGVPDYRTRSFGGTK